MSASIPAVVGEYAYYANSLMGTDKMLHYWNISTPEKPDTFCHFSHPSPNLNIRGAVMMGRIVNIRRQLATY